MRCRPGVGEGTVGMRQRFADSTKSPQREGVISFRGGARILAEPVGEIGMARMVVELDGLLKMVMGASKVAEVKTGGAGNAVRDQGLGAIGPESAADMDRRMRFLDAVCACIRMILSQSGW